MPTHDIEFPAGYFKPWHEGEPMTPEMETPTRGCLDVVVVINGERYPVAFYDRERLTQELQREVAAYTSLVVVPEVNTDAIRRAIAGLVEEGFFNGLRPLPRENG